MRKKPPGPRWQEFMHQAFNRLVIANGFQIVKPGDGGFLDQVAREIVAHGAGAAFLKSVRRGRPTARQNFRYQLLREVEKLMGDQVKRRRPANNIPDALALKAQAALPDLDQREFGI